MKRINALGMGIAAVLVLTVSLSAQVIKQVPANALVVVKFSDIGATNKKLIDFFTNVGLSEMGPGFKDPLQCCKDNLGIQDGINSDGEAAFVYLDSTAYATAPTPAQAVLFLIPVTDYDKFIGNFPKATKDGAVTVTPISPNDPTPGYIAHWGDYAVLSPVEALVAQPPTDIIKVDDLTARELGGKDLVILANMSIVRKTLLPEIESFQTMMAPMIDGVIRNGHLSTPGIDLPKFAPVIKAFFSQMMAGSKRCIADSQFVTVGINLSPDGIAASLVDDFDPDSYLGKFAAQLKNTDAHLLTGLPDGKYLFLTGGVQDPKANTPLIDDMLGPIEKSVADMGPDAAPLSDTLANVKAAFAAETGSALGLFTPVGTPGQIPLGQGAVIIDGDAKTLQDISRKSFQTMNDTIKFMDGASGVVPTATCTQDSKTLDGVSFDEVHMSFDPNASAQTPQSAVQITMMNYMYGPGGLYQCSASINDSTRLTVTDLDDSQISSIIDTLKAQTSPIEEDAAFKAVASQLPADRLAVIYLPIDQWCITGLGFAKMEGFDAGVQFPEGLSPIGITISADGSAIRCDEYIPMKLIEATVSTAIQIKMALDQRNGGGGPGL